MLLLVRIIFCLITSFLSLLFSAFLGAMFEPRHRVNEAKNKMVIISNILVGVFATLYFVKIGLI